MIKTLWSYLTLVYRFNLQHAATMVALTGIRAEVEALARKATQ